MPIYQTIPSFGANIDFPWQLICKKEISQVQGPVNEYQIEFTEDSIVVQRKGRMVLSPNKN